jgi:cytochrome P450
LLSQSREWRERVRAEADREFDGSLEGLADRLPVTRAVIDETNRLYPPITAISRIALGPDELAGESIKPGSSSHFMCCIVIERYGQNLTISIPARFRGDERTKIDRFAYLPFGVGPRICIGATFAIH